MSIPHQHVTEKLKDKIRCVEKTTPLSELTEQLLGRSEHKGPLVTIEPKTLVFSITDPDVECKTSFLITNNTDKMELFKVTSFYNNNSNRGQ